MRFLVSVLSLSLFGLLASGCAGPAGADSEDLDVADTSSIPDESTPADVFSVDTGVLDPRVPPTNAFPYVYEDDDPAPAHLRFRAEGLPLEETFLHALDYLKKSVDKKFTAPSAEVAYFEDQRALLATIRHEEVPGDALALGAVGDIMWIKDSWSTFLDPEVLAWMQGVDLWVGNLETPVAGSFDVPDSYPQVEFNAHPDLVLSFTDPSGVPLWDALSFANNHTMDMGAAGAEETLEFLSDTGIPSAGVWETEGARYAAFSEGGISVGFYAATWGLNQPELLTSTDVLVDHIPGLAPPGVDPVDLSGVRETLARMAENGVDLKVVYLHWGHEYEYYPSPQQMIVAREIVHAGADILIGAHSHAHQPPEVCFVNGYEARYTHHGGCVLTDPAGRPRRALILYSLGNFATTMGTFLGQLGTLHRIPIYRTEDGTVEWAAPEHLFVYNEQDLAPDGSHRLMGLDAWLDAGCYGEASGCDPANLEQLAFLRDHLFDLEVD